MPSVSKHEDAFSWLILRQAQDEGTYDSVRAMADEIKIVDARGLICPLPVLRAKQALRAIPVGGVLVLECTDPLTEIDVPHFVNQTGHALSAQTRDGDLYIFRIVKQR